MRIALVSPYSWSYQGGVNHHVEALSEEFERGGDEVRILAPVDPPGLTSKAMHRAEPTSVPPPDNLIPLGRTVGINANGAVSNLSLSPAAIARARRELRHGRYDVIHVHEPVAPLISWDSAARPHTPTVGTFHAYSTKAIPNHLASLAGARRVFNRLSRRIAVSEAAAWTGKRWFGGRYEIIPNGVDLGLSPDGPKQPADHLRVLFVGRPEVRKGLPVLLQAFGGLAEQVPARLTIIGAEHDDVMRYLADRDLLEVIETHGRVSSNQLWRSLHEADVLCAPSLAGESFGMVLTEAFAAGTPVIASEIAGYVDVVDDGVNGVLVPPADPQRLAEELQRAHHEPERMQAMGEQARRSAERYAWSRVAGEVRGVYEDAIAAPEPVTRRDRFAVRAGLKPADGLPRVPALRMASPDPPPAVEPARGRRIAQRLGVGLAGALAVGLSVAAASRIGVDSVAASIVRSDVSWIAVACALMAASLFMRAASWYWIAHAALPRVPLRRRDVTSAAMIGVLMSATLPARLGEPARALALARRTGSMRSSFPVLVGTLISQTMLNIVALLCLGLIIVTSTSLFATSTTRLFAFSLVPFALLLAVVLAPMVMRPQGDSRASRLLEAVRRGLVQVRRGLTVFRNLRAGPPAAAAQLGAWAVQLTACWALIQALGLSGEIGIGAAAAVLFAVNVTAVVPVTPSNIGVFQLAVISVLSTGYGIGTADALAFGVILQGVEVATALALGIPALLREGLTWSDMRMQALSAAPVRLSPHPRAEAGSQSSARV